MKRFILLRSNPTLISLLSTSCLWVNLVKHLITRVMTAGLWLKWISEVSWTPPKNIVWRISYKCDYAHEWPFLFRLGEACENMDFKDYDWVSSFYALLLLDNVSLVATGIVEQSTGKRKRGKTRIPISNWGWEYLPCQIDNLLEKSTLTFCILFSK